MGRDRRLGDGRRDAGGEAQAVPRQRHPLLSPRPRRHDRAGPAWQRRAYSIEAMRALARARAAAAGVRFRRWRRGGRADAAAERGRVRRDRACCRSRCAARRRAICRSRCSASASSLPVIVGPTGLAGLFWPDGERCAARAAAAAGTAYCLSHGSVCTLEELAATGAAPRWMQVFIYKDRGFTRELAERAADGRLRRAGAHHRQSAARQSRARHPQRLRASRRASGRPEICRHGAQGRLAVAHARRARSASPSATMCGRARPPTSARSPAAWRRCSIRRCPGRMSRTLRKIWTGPLHPQGHPASGGGAGRRRARHRRADRLQSWRPAARRRAGDASKRCRRSSMRSAAGSRSCIDGGVRRGATW